MDNTGFCKRCGSIVSAERQYSDVVVCDACGHTESQTETELETKAQKHILIGAGVFSALLIVSFIHLIQWQNHFVTAIPLSIKSALGLASVEDYKQISQICRELEKGDCVVAAHRSIASLDSNNLDSVKDYGRVLYMAGDHAEALKVYESYFKRGGDNLDAAFDFARLLSHADRDKEASDFFLKVLEAKKDVLQITVAEAYVEHLIRIKDLKTAKNFISAWRAKGDNTGSFLERQLQKIKDIEKVQS